MRIIWINPYIKTRIAMSWENNIRNRFEGAEFQPSDEVWLHVRTQITPPVKPRYAWLSAPSLAMAAAIALLLVAGTALWLYQPRHDHPVASHHPALPVPPQGSEIPHPAAQAPGNPSHMAPPHAPGLSSPGAASTQAPPAVGADGMNPPATPDHMPLTPAAPFTPVPGTPDPEPVRQPQPVQQTALEITALQAMASPSITPETLVRQLPTLPRIHLADEPTWVLPETGLLALVPDAFREPRKPQWRIHTTVMPYRMNPFAYARKSLDQTPLVLQPNDTIITYRLPSIGVSWQAMAEYQIGCNWSVEIGLQVAHTVASAPLAYNYVVIRPGEPTPANTANMSREDATSLTEGVNAQEVESYTYTEKHIAIRAPILVTLYQRRGRHSLSASVGGARLVNLSKIIPMRRMDIEAIARMRYEYALTPSLSVHSGIQFGTPTPRGDFLTPMHIGLQTGLSFRWPS